MTQRPQHNGASRPETIGRARPTRGPGAAQLARNPARVCVFHGLHMSLFPMAILVLFQREELGFDMADIFVIQAIFSGAAALFEFPGGYLADQVGYRKSLMVGATLSAGGWLSYVFADDFWSVAVAEVWLAAGLALISGADAALMYESLLSTDAEQTYTTWFSRYRSTGQASEGTAALAGAWVFTLWPRGPFALTVLCWLANLAVAAGLREPPRSRGSAQPALQRALSVLRYAAFDQPHLRSVIALFLALNIPSYVMVWILPLYLVDMGVNPVWLGPVWAVSSYVVAGGSLLSPRLGARFGVMPTLAGCVLLVAVGYLGLGLAQGVAGLGCYLALCLLRGVQGALLQHQEQRLIASSDRASLLSVKTLLFRLAFTLLAPFIGAALDRYGQQPVLIVLALPMTLAAAAAWLSLALHRQRAGLDVKAIATR